MNRLQGIFLLIVFLFLTGCAHVISKDLRIKAQPPLTFKEAFQNPDAYRGRTVIWGGDIVKTINQKDGTTLIEVFQRPLGWKEEPKVGPASGGRFLVLAEKYLDPYIFRKGRKITVAGEILGVQIRPLGEMDYRYPLLSSLQIYLWSEYYDSPGPYYYPYYDYPGPYYPYYYYDPWWGYPFYWGFRYYYYR
jgi:outer membrane lipoprotein